MEAGPDVPRTSLRIGRERSATVLQPLPSPKRGNQVWQCRNLNEAPLEKKRTAALVCEKAAHRA
jgi:hypothetical protein